EPSLGQRKERSRGMCVADPDLEARKEGYGKCHEGLDAELHGCACSATDEEAAEGRADQTASAPGRVERGHDRPAPAAFDDACMGVHRHIDENIEHAEQERADRQW